MNPLSPALTPQKLGLLCDHLENLCAQSARLMRAGESVALEELQGRKATILEELRRGLEGMGAAADPHFRSGVARRLTAALSEELRAVNEILIGLKGQLHEQAAGELRLAKIRRGYGAYAKREESGHDVSISACG